VEGALRERRDARRAAHVAAYGAEAIASDVCTETVAFVGSIL
jgi:hypothetical protein